MRTKATGQGNGEVTRRKNARLLLSGKCDCCVDVEGEDVPTPLVG